MIRFFSSSFFLLFLMIACNSPQEPQGASEVNTADRPPAKAAATPTEEFLADIEQAHAAAAFHRRPAVSFDLQLFFGGKERLNATIASLTNSSKVRLDRQDGVSLFYDGESVYQAPADSDYPGARFDIFTWQYFFMAPFKMSDPGTRWELLGPSSLKEITCETAKLTFEDGTGDAPDDWYVVYQNAETGRLEAMAYIVTFNKSQEEAEEEPHAITYSEYETVEGVPFATRWEFWMWTEEKGVHQQLGEARISNIRFKDPEPGFFVPSEGAKEVPL